MAETEWKGAVWKSAFGNFSVKEILTILKGFGPMEVLEFDKPESFRGKISISLDSNGNKQITIYHLEVSGGRRCGHGREALQWLKKIFKGELFVEDPGIILVRNANEASLLFWIKMYREGLIGALESELCTLSPGMSQEELQKVEKLLGMGGLGSGRGPHFSDDAVVGK